MWPPRAAQACYDLSLLDLAFRDCFAEDSAIVYRLGAQTSVARVSFQSCWARRTVPVVRPIGESQEPEGASNKTRGRRGLGPRRPDCLALVPQLKEYRDPPQAQS